MSLTQNVTKIVNIVGSKLLKHEPEILTGLGIACWTGATVTAVKATPSASKKLEKRKEELKVEKLTLKDTVKEVGKMYAFPASLALAGSLCSIKSTSVSNKRYAALATSFELATEAARVYKDKVIETIGKKKNEQIETSIAQDNVDKNPPTEKTIVITDKGNTLFRDSLTGQYFRGDINDVKHKAIDIANSQLNNYNGYVEVDEWLSSLGLVGTDLTSDLGWSTSDQFKAMQIMLCPVTAHEYNDEPCHEIRYEPMPVSDEYIKYR